MRIIRLILTPIILFLDWITTPRSVKRPADEQQEIDRQTRGLSLYQFKACPFCIKVRRACKRHALNIETRDARNNAQHRQELLEQGGRVKVPCLRIEKDNGEAEWLYESGDIIAYLEQRFIAQAARPEAG